MISEIHAGPLVIWLLPCLQDNYIFVLHHQEVHKTIVVDPGDAQVVSAFLQKQRLSLNEIWITHHHRDHIDGVLALKEEYSCVVRGSIQVPGRIPGVTIPVDANSSWLVGDIAVSVLFLPGHTLDHIAYWLQWNGDSLLFSGDVLFGLGCGRIFEGTFEQMFSSLSQLTQLPKSTRVFCTHEYTEKNLQFTLSQRPEDQALQERVRLIQELRSQGRPTVPLSLQEELATNLFLRSLNQKNAFQEFKRLRELRNKY